MYDVKPKIYVACLAAYNNGRLHGQWIDVVQPPAKIYRAINQMLSMSPIPHAEEWAIHDYEGFSPIHLSENESIEHVSELANFIVQRGAIATKLVEYYGDKESAERALDCYYHGEYDNELDFAIELFDECYSDSIPENLKGYIDYEAFQRDIFIDTYLSIDVAGKVHVFEQH